MATTKITSNVLALSAAQTNINNDGSFTLSVPTLINNTVSVSGNLTVDTNTFFVNSANNRVGIGTNNPLQAIDFRPVTFEANQSGGIRFDNTAGQWPCGIYIRSDGVGGPRLSLDAPYQTNTLNLYSNNVGIGTTTPNEKLTVVGNISATGNLTVDTNTFFVDSVNNRVGIGVSPLSSIVGKLDVTGSPATTTPSDVLVLSRPFNAGIGFPSIVSFKLANPNTSINNTRLDIALMQANSNTPRSPDTTVMTLMGDGNVGIGTTTPNEKLTVVGNISATGDLTASRPSGNSVSLSIQQGSINTWALSSVASSTALDVTSTTGSKMRLYENGDAAFGVLPGQNLLELKAGTALEIKFPFYSSYAFAGNINFSDYSSIGSLRSGAGFYMGTGVKTANSNGNSLLKTSVSSSQAHFFYTRYDRGLEFHSGITGNQNDIIADTTNLRSRISPEGVFYIGSNSNGTGFPAQLKIETLWTNVPAFQTKLITSQTSDHYRWTDSSNNVQGVINNLGSVGIGTATPNEKLTVVGNISATGNLSAANVAVNTAGILSFAPRSAQNISQSILTDASDSLYLGTTNAGKLVFIGSQYTSARSSFFQTNKLYIGDDSNNYAKPVPQDTLTVKGAISASGIVTAEGNKLAAETFAIAMAIAIG